jgi:hypothetical protein
MASTLRTANGFLLFVGPLCIVWFGLAGHLPPAERCAAPGLGPGQGVQDPRSVQVRLRRPRALRHLCASARHLVDAGRLILIRRCRSLVILFLPSLSSFILLFRVFSPYFLKKRINSSHYQSLIQCLVCSGEQER